MAQLFANNARSELAQPISAGATSITLTSTTGARFPAVNLGGDYFLLTLYNLVGNVETDIEIVRVISRVNDVLTVQRAQEGTTAKAYLAGAKAELRITADSFNTIDAIEVLANSVISRGVIQATGVITAGGGFSTTEDSFLGEITVSGTATFNQQVNATMGLSANTINVTGPTTLAALTTSGALTANGAVVLNSAVSLTGDQIQVSEGGTGATTAADARTNLDIYSKAEADARFINITDTDLTLTNSLNITGANGVTTTRLSASGLFSLTGDQVQVSEGGTGATTAATARANLGTVSDTAANGIAVRTAANTLTARSLTAGTGVSITNPDGVAGNPSITNTGVLAITTNTGLSTNTNATGSVTITNVDRGSAQNIFKNITNAAGATQFSAVNNTDSLSFAATGTTSVAFDSTNRRITVSSADQFTGTVTSVAVAGTNGLTVTGSPITTSGTINITTNATAVNTAGTIVSRDANGNFAAGVITAALAGNASTASTWQTPRVITLAGDLTGSVTVDGSGDATLTATVAPDSVVLGTDTTGNYVASVAVAGVGLSVNNAPGEGTAITVTSNATNVNTASTVVARDASGNFAAGTITAALTGNASTATTLQTARTINGVSFNGSANITVTANTPTALTFNNGGAGGASGSTFNGGTALTVSYNTVGAPSTTGAGASGTWAINITGNAATATSATTANSANTATTANNANALGGISSNRAMLKRKNFIGNGSGLTLNDSIAAPEMGFTYGGSGETVGPYIAFGGLGGDIDYSCQIVAQYNGGGNRMQFRTRNDDAQVWNPFREVIHDGNFNSYSPTLTGGGASGTWGINITGNAASATTAANTTGNANTATTLQTARTISLSGGVTGSVSFNGGANVNIATTVTSPGVPSRLITWSGAAVAGPFISISSVGNRSTGLPTHYAMTSINSAADENGINLQAVGYRFNN